MKYKSTQFREKHDYVNTPTYRSWYNMKSRCNNPNYKNSYLWKGKGIKYPDRWESFIFFLSDMGERPEGTSLDRIDGNKSYSKLNCRWATPKEQMNNTYNNRFLSFNGQTMTLQQWADELGMHRKTLSCRIDKYGWSIEKALTTEVRSKICK